MPFAVGLLGASGMLARAPPAQRLTQASTMSAVIGTRLLASSTPLTVPIFFTAWGLFCWFAGFRRLLRDPRTGIREIAEARARSRLLHPFGGGDVEMEFRQQWRMRWVLWVAVVGYALGTVGAWIAALRG